MLLKLTAQEASDLAFALDHTLSDLFGEGEVDLQGDPAARRLQTLRERILSLARGQLTTVPSANRQFVPSELAVR